MIELGLSMLGAGIGILVVAIVSQLFLGREAGTGLVASMGATAVLLFAVPHGALSQPWPVAGGHLVSALIGVACAKMLSVQPTSIALAVAMSVGAMQFLRCIHPPGGATAFAAMVGGEPVHQLGYQFVLTPVLLNLLTILLVATLFNYPFRWRRYPSALAFRSDGQSPGPIIENASVRSPES